LQNGDPVFEEFELGGQGVHFVTSGDLNVPSGHSENTKIKIHKIESYD